MSSGVSSKFLQDNFNSDKTNDSLIYEFEDFRLDATHLMLYRNDEVVSLAPKEVETLVALVEKRGQVVSKNELMDRLWADTAVEESNLSQNLYVLRKTLGKLGGGKPYIETFRRRGYRFNGEIRDAVEIGLSVVSRTKTLVVTEETIEEAPKGYEEPIRKLKVTDFGLFHRRRTLFIITAMILAGLVVAGLVGSFRPSSNPEPSPPVDVPLIKMARLTPDLNVPDAAISQDSKYLAYNLLENGKYGLWLKDITSGSTVQIMPSVENGFYGNLTFSPDGTQIYYNTRPNPTVNYTLNRIPAFGGEPQKVAENVISPATISPDGKQAAFVGWADAAESRLIIADSDGTGERILSKRRRENGWYESWGSHLSWSPDGQKIVVCGAKVIDGKIRFELIEVSVAEGTERNIPVPDWRNIDDVAWLSGERALLVTVRETEASPRQIWRVSYPDGAVSRVTNDDNEYDDLSLSGDSHTLVVRKNLGNVNLWTLPLSDASRAKQITFANAASDGRYGLAFAQEGKIIYTSPRSGKMDLWMMNADGSGQKQLTRNAGEFNGRPRITPDGESIIFVSSRTGMRQIWRMDVDGANPQQLTHGVAADHPWISPDGAWIYFTLYQESRQIIAKIPVLGGVPVSVYEKNNPELAVISPDGKRMLFVYYEESSPQPWKTMLLSLETSETLKIAEGTWYGQSWTADSASLIAVGEPRTNLWLVPVDGGKPRQLTNFESGQIRNFSVSPDFNHIAFSRGNPSSEAILITDF